MLVAGQFWAHTRWRYRTLGNRFKRSIAPLDSSNIRKQDVGLSYGATSISIYGFGLGAA